MESDQQRTLFDALEAKYLYYVISIRKIYKYIILQTYTISRIMIKQIKIALSEGEPRT